MQVNPMIVARLFALGVALGGTCAPAVGVSCALADVQWMAAAWRNSGGEDQAEGRWVATPDGTLMGSSWTAAKHGPGFAELMTITSDSAQVVMRLRHFDMGLKSAWEDKGAPMQFALEKCNRNFAVFAGMDSHAGERLTYSRSGDELTVIGDFLHGGTPVREQFNFRKLSD